MSFYLVMTKCGHVGKTKYIPITFPISAENKKDAARIARNMPRVKHHHKDAIISVKEVLKNEFEFQEKINESDLYLKAKNKQEQNQIADFKSRLLDDDYNINKYHKVKNNKHKKNNNYKIRKQKIIDNQNCIETQYYKDYPTAI